MKNYTIYTILLLLYSWTLNGQGFEKAVRGKDSGLNFIQKAELINRYYDTARGSNRSGYKQWKRWEWFAGHHLSEGGTLANFALKNNAVLEARKQEMNNGMMTNSNSGNWISVGHSGHTGGTNFCMQGRVNCLAFDPVDPSIVYAGTAGGGVWKTFDAGVNWINISGNLPVITISSITIAPDGVTIYIITGDCVRGSGYIHDGLGVFKSSDAGNSWQRTGLNNELMEGFGGSKIRVHPSNSNIIIAATRFGLFRSLDAGGNWTLLKPGNITDFEFKPGDANTLYYSIYRLSFLAKLDLTTLNESFVFINAVNNPVIERLEIGVTPASPDVVYLLAGPGFSGGGAGTPDGTAFYNGLYYSNDGGENFVMRNDNVDVFSINDQSWYDIVIYVDPINVNHVMIGGVRLYSSLDGGVHFTLVSDGANDNSIHHDSHAFERNPLDASLYIGNDGGVHRSANGGTTWNPISGNMVINEYYRISGFQGLPDLLIGGTQDNGFFRKNSSNPSFYTPYILLDMMDNIIDLTNPDRMYTCSQGGGLNTSVNGGASFAPVNIPNGGGNWVTPIIQLPSASFPLTVFYGSKNGVLRTPDAGGTWVNIGGPLSADCFAIGTDGGNFRLIVSKSASLQICNNPNAVSPTWSALIFPSGDEISSIAMNPGNMNEVWVTCKGYFSGSKVYRSGDGGISWSNLSMSLPNIPVYTIAFGNNNNNPPGAVYIGTELGIYYTDNTLPDWEPFYNGLPMCPVTDLFVNYAGNRIYASTYGRGIWQSDLFNSCPGPLFLSGSVYGNNFYQSSSFIETTQALEGSVGNDLRLRAPQKITLKPGFYSKNGAYLHVLIGNCGTGIFNGPTIDSTRKNIP